MNAIVQYAVEEARAYAEGGMDGIIVENSWDLPFLRPEDIWYETVATMSVVADSVREATSVPIGINVLANAGEAAIAAAKASRASFIRVNQWVNAYVSNEGIVQGNSAQILRYRAILQAQESLSSPMSTSNMALMPSSQIRPVEEQARDVEFFDADVAIATGNHTGRRYTNRRDRKHPKRNISSSACGQRTFGGKRCSIFWKKRTEQSWEPA